MELPAHHLLCKHFQDEQKRAEEQRTQRIEQLTLTLVQMEAPLHANCKRDEEAE